MWLSVPMAPSIQAILQDVERRLKTHNAGKGAKYTRARLPVKLLYSEAFASKPEAMSAEALFKKKSREKKLAYIKEHTEK